jgi:hypothetical protein
MYIATWIPQIIATVRVLNAEWYVSIWSQHAALHKQCKMRIYKSGESLWRSEYLGRYSIAGKLPGENGVQLICCIKLKRKGEEEGRNNK